MKKIFIFGSSGSIGRNALDVIRKAKEKFSVAGLCVYRNVKMLEKQVKEFSPRYVCIVNENAAKKAKAVLPRGIKIFSGERGLDEFSSLPSDISLVGISGISCLRPLLINIKAAQRIALANKESLVVGAELVKELAQRYGTEILPVDSEINALFQLLGCTQKDQLEKVFLTASGGALLDWGRHKLGRVAARDVLQHPTWKMGKRITVDSATLVNKAFEVIEAHQFFDLDYSSIDIVIHRESKVHALVEMRDGIIFSCVYNSDMRIPIGHALYYPQRIPLFKNNSLCIKGNAVHTFQPVDTKKFPLLKLILRAAQRGDNSLAIMNACDEVAIDYFLQGKIKFTAIYKVLEYFFSHYKRSPLATQRDIFHWDGWARIKTKEYLEKRCC